MVWLPIVVGDRGPDCENSKEPILLQRRDIEEALYNHCVLNLAFSFFFLNENYQFLNIYSKPICT